MEWWIAGAAWVVVLVFALALCKAAARGDRMAEEAFSNLLKHMKEETDGT